MIHARAEAARSTSIAAEELNIWINHRDITEKKMLLTRRYLIEKEMEEYILC